MLRVDLLGVSRLFSHIPQHVGLFPSKRRSNDEKSERLFDNWVSLRLAHAYLLRYFTPGNHKQFQGLNNIVYT